MGLETFDSNEVLEVPDVNGAQTSGGDGLDTFDSPLDIKEEVKEEKEESKGDEKVDPDSQVNLLKEQEDKNAESKSEQKDEKKDDDKEGTDGEKKEEDAGKKEEDEKVGEEKPDVKKGKEIKGRFGEDEFGIPTETEISVRVKGKKEDVTVQELINNYSGQKNWDQEYSKLGEEKKEFAIKNEQLTGEVEYLQGHIKSIVDILNNEEANPMDALEYLLDTTGRDTLQFKKRVMETMIDEVESLQEMDSVERELYWKNQELSNLKRRQESSELQSRQGSEEIQLREKVDSLRETNNVSEDNFVTAHLELEELGYKDITPEQVVDYAALKPHFATTEELLSEYSEELDSESMNSLVSEIAVDLLKGSITKKEVKVMLEEEFGDTKKLESLTKRASANAKAKEKERSLKYKAKGEDHFESFDDF